MLPEPLPIIAEHSNSFIVKLDLTAAYKVLKNYQGLGKSGEVILARQDPISRKVALVSPLRSDTTAAIQLRDPKDKFVARLFTCL